MGYLSKQSRVYSYTRQTTFQSLNRKKQDSPLTKVHDTNQQAILDKLIH